MNRYLEDLDAQIGCLKEEIERTESDFGNMREDFEAMEWQLDDIKDVLKSNKNPEEKIYEIERILQR